MKISKVSYACFFVLANAVVNAMLSCDDAFTPQSQKSVSESSGDDRKPRLTSAEQLPIENILQNKAVYMHIERCTYPVHVNIFLKQKLIEEKSLETQPITNLFKTEWEACKSRHLSQKVTSINFTLGRTQETKWKIFCQPFASIKAFK